MIAGTNSGCGKTTITLAILAAYASYGVDLASFKCGPDYIDPMFHRAAVGVPSYNLDPFFCGQKALCNVLLKYGRDLCVLEGVMGYYDGVGIKGDYSSYQVAADTRTPVILVLNAHGMSTSAGAILQGFLHYKEKSGVRGVIFNNIAPGMYLMLAEIAKQAGILPLGFLPKNEKVAISSRHLGLITAEELPDLEEKLKVLKELAEEYLDLDGILALASSAPELDSPQNRKDIPPRGKTVTQAHFEVKIQKHPRIAVACDEAFCFIYQENLDLLSSCGAILVPFSPLHDKTLPEDISGLYLPGGYPEVHSEELSGNDTMLKAVSHAVRGGLPTIAECGGFLYLHAHLDGHPMAGVIPADAKKTDHLQHFGYVTLTAKQDNLLCKAGGQIRSHEFHYYESTDAGEDYSAIKASGKEEYSCIHATDTLYAGFPHLYLPANPSCAENFIKKAAGFRMTKDH